MRHGALVSAAKTLRRIGIAADHGGYELKEYLSRQLRQAGYEVVDFGDGRPTEDNDQPDFIVPLARAVAAGMVERGVGICGEAVGASACANKVAGVWACLIHETFTAHPGVDDDDWTLILLWWSRGRSRRRRGTDANISPRTIQRRGAFSSSPSESNGARNNAMKTSPLAGKPAPVGILVDVPRLVSAYFTRVPDPAVPAQRVAFGTPGHRGSSFKLAFNEWHILAITQAICLHRKRHNISGPLYLGIDTHALSVAACAAALEVLAANAVEVMLGEWDEYTPTPVISHAILTYNRGRTKGQADGIVITPAHNPPHDGGFKYNPPNDGPADNVVTGWIETKANTLLEARLKGVKRIRSAKIHHDVDPLGGAGVHYWARIAEWHGLNLAVVDEMVDPTFRFMTVDRDGQIRMDPSSPYAMQRLIGMKDRYDLPFAGDTDHDRHGIVTKSGGLLPPRACYELSGVTVTKTPETQMF